MSERTARRVEPNDSRSPAAWCPSISGHPGHFRRSGGLGYRHPGGGTLKVAPPAHGIALDGTTSARRAVHLCAAHWATEDAGLGAEDVGRKFAASVLPVGR